MRTSRFGVVRKLWWLPQTYSIEQNIYGRFTRGLTALAEIRGQVDVHSP